MSRGKYKNKKNKGNSVSKGIAAAAAFAAAGLTGLTEASNVKLVGLNNVGKTEGDVSGESDNWSLDSMGLRGTNFRWSSVDEDFDKTESPDSVLNVEKVGQPSKNKYPKNPNLEKLSPIDQTKVGPLPSLDLEEITKSEYYDLNSEYYERLDEQNAEKRKPPVVKAMNENGIFYNAEQIYEELRKMSVEHFIAVAPPDLLKPSFIRELGFKTKDGDTLEEVMGLKELNNWLISLDKSWDISLGSVQGVNTLISEITSGIERSKESAQNILSIKDTIEKNSKESAQNILLIKDTIEKNIGDTAAVPDNGVALEQVVGNMLAVGEFISLKEKERALKEGVDFVLNALLLNSLYNEDMDKLLEELPRKTRESDEEYLERKIAFLQVLDYKASFLSKMMITKANNLTNDLINVCEILDYSDNDSPMLRIANFMASLCKAFHAKCLKEMLHMKKSMLKEVRSMSAAAMLAMGERSICGVNLLEAIKQKHKEGKMVVTLNDILGKQKTSEMLLSFSNEELQRFTNIVNGAKKLKDKALTRINNGDVELIADKEDNEDNESICKKMKDFVAIIDNDLLTTQTNISKLLMRMLNFYSKNIDAEGYPELLDIASDFNISVIQILHICDNVDRVDETLLTQLQCSMEMLEYFSDRLKEKFSPMYEYLNFDTDPISKIVECLQNRYKEVI